MANQMMDGIEKQIEELKRLSVSELRAKYFEVFGEPTKAGNRDWLWKRIAWRIQELKHGGISERAKRRAAEIVNEADLRVRPPRGIFDPNAQGAQTTEKSFNAQDKRLPPPGTLLTREYQGRSISVTVLADGVEYEGEKYGSLSAVARAITGTRWNGFLFFGL